MTATTERPLLEVAGVRKRFGGLQAVGGVDLSIAPAELRCVIGPNGAGKSTLFRLIMGYYRADAGTIRFEGEDVSRAQVWQRARAGIGIKLQVPGLYQGLSVYENLRIAVQQRACNAKQIHAEVERLMLMLGLDDVAETHVEHLSHGLQQWLEIGVALGTQPRLLLLDEPTAGMSPEETLKMAAIVQALTRDGVAVMVIEHDMAFVRLVATKITVLHNGRVLTEGTPTEVEAHEDVLKVYLGKG